MKLNRTTKRTIDILKIVSGKPEGVTLDEICEKLELPKTSAYDIVTTLAETGMLNIVRGQKQSYTIGLMAYRIGVNYINNLDFISAIEPELKAFPARWERPCSSGCGPITRWFTSVNSSRRIPSSPRPRWGRKSDLLHLPGEGHFSLHRRGAEKAGHKPGEV